MPGVKLLTGDLTDLPSLIRAFATAQPDEVYNLGAISFVAYSWENAGLTADVTGRGVLNMLEACRLYAGDDISRVRFYQASQLGDVRQGAGRCRSPRPPCCGRARPTAWPRSSATT